MRDHSSGSYKPQIKTFQGLILEETALEKIPPLPLPAFVGFWCSLACGSFTPILASVSTWFSLCICRVLFS